MKHLLMFRRTSGLIFIMLLLTGLYACGEDEEQYTPPGLGVPVPVFELKREVYADPGIFDQPRVQFVWQGPERNREEIWSVKIDGTDLRLVADEGLLYINKNYSIHPVFSPQRSPDNQYILVPMVDGKTNDFVIFIIDLKNKKIKSIMKSGDYELLLKSSWVGDSQSFFYRNNDSLVRYYLKSGKKIVIRNSLNVMQYVQQNSEKIFEIKNDGFIVWDFDGNELRKEELGNIHRNKHHISANGKFMYFVRMDLETGSIISTKNIDSEISVPTSHIPLLTNDGQYYMTTGNLSIYDKESQTVKNLFTKFGGRKYSYKFGRSLGMFTLFNEKDK